MHSLKAIIIESIISKSNNIFNKLASNINLWLEIDHVIQLLD